MYALKWFKQLAPAELPECVLLKLQHLQGNLQGSTVPVKALKPKKQGTDKIISDIVSDLNKLTPDTYKNLYPALLKNMQLCLPEQLQRVAGGNGRRLVRECGQFACDAGNHPFSPSGPGPTCL